jgi:hypothetical protein
LRVNGSFAAEKGGNGRVICFFEIRALSESQKNKSHVQKTSFTAEGGVIRTQILNEPLSIKHKKYELVIGFYRRWFG